MTDTADWTFSDYVAGDTPLPSPNLAWNTYGKGVENMGKDGAPEHIDIPEPGDDQLLIRIDAVGLCFSDVKLIRQGGEHAKLYGRDLRVEPTRLGHEPSVTVIKVGKDLDGKYHEGQRLAIQPDIHVDGMSTAYGYTIPGGLIQYHVIGSEVLDADDGSYVIPVDDSLGYAAAALSEPWACVLGAFTQRRRLTPMDGGTMWIIGSADDPTEYTSSQGIGNPSTIVLSNVSPHVASWIEGARGEDSTVVIDDGLTPENVAERAAAHTGEDGFDDIFVLAQTSAALIEEVAKTIAFRGTMTMVGTEPLDGNPQTDVGRLHYHYTAYLGTTSNDISEAWGEERNRADLVAGGVTVVVGAGGPMGQMHMQRAIEMDNGPATIIGLDLDQERMDRASTMLAPMAEKAGRTLIIFNSGEGQDAVDALIAEHSGGGGADDVIVSVPSGPLMGESAKMMGPNGMLVLFAGVLNGTMAPLNLSDVYLNNAQFTGTSGSSIADQESVIHKTVEGSLTPSHNLAAVGGIDAGADGIQSLIDGDYAGKVMIFPQLVGLGLTGLDELAEKHPDIAELLGPNNTWTNEAEQLLFEKYHA